MNVVFIDGRIVPNTEKSSKNYVYQAANGEKKSYLHFLVSTRKEGAPKGENGYYPTMLKAMKAFGETADQINKNFGPGNYILVQGSLSQDEDFVGNDGVTHRGMEYVKVNRIWYGDFSGKSKEEQVAEATQSPSAAKKATGKTLSRPQGIDSPF